MKWNKILTMFFLGASFLSSCSQEALVEPNEEILTADVSVAFAVQDVKTKAYINAIGAETALSDVYVALYDSEDNFIKGQSVVNPNLSGEITVGEGKASYTVPAYKVTFEDIRTGKNGKQVYAVVVANAEVTSAAEIAEPYSVENANTTGATLVKAGKSAPILLTAGKGTSNPVIEVPMIQLAAGIKFMGIMDDVGNAVSCDFTLSHSGINLSTDLDIFDNTRVQNTQFNASESTSMKDATIFYTYESVNESFSPMLTVVVTYDDEKDKNYIYNISISKVLEEQGLDLIKGHLYSITGRLSSRDLEMEWKVIKAETIDVKVPDFN